LQHSIKNMTSVIQIVRLIDYDLAQEDGGGGVDFNGDLNINLQSC